jgi:hypothetical protein
MGRLAAVLALVLTVSHGIPAQVRAFVPPDSPIYEDIDRLAAARLIDTIVIGTRPYTEREIVRLLSEAKRNLDRRAGGTEWAARAIAAGLRRYDRSTRGGIEMVSANLTFLGSPYRAIPADDNGSVDATINPLAAYQAGRPLVNGTTSTIETTADVSLGRYVAVSLQPRMAFGMPRSTPSDATLGVQSGSVVGAFGNLVVDVGRSYLQFSQSYPSGLLLSGNSPPLDMIRISTERPAALPWLFRLLGPMYGTLFVADLGTSHQTHPHAKLAGYHVSMLPHPNLELGAEVIDETGGNGSPAGTFTDRVVDLFPIFDLPLLEMLYRGYGNLRFSNKLAGMDARLRVPSLAGMEMYAEVAVDDADIRRLRSTLLEDGGIIGGVAWTCLTECGRWVTRLEYHQTGIRYYTHTDFSSGVQQQGDLLGDPLGPRGLGGYASFDAEVGRFGRLKTTAAHEVRSGNLYRSAASDSTLADFHFEQIVHRPGEHRTRVGTEWRTGRVDSRWSATIGVGIEMVTNADFVADRRRLNSVARLSTEWRP